MFETLYKTDKPAELARAEYYQVHLDQQLINGSVSYVVREKHGWFSDSEKRAFHTLTTLDPEAGYATYEQALRAYEKQALHRASEGFVHSFMFDPFFAFRYRKVE